MNYIYEMNSFFDWIETNSISTAAMNLWHALMNINNNVVGKRNFRFHERSSKQKQV